MAGATLNKVMLIGRLGQDPKISYTQSGSPVVNMSLATDEGYKDRQSGQFVERTEWHRVVVFGQPAEFCANYLAKGRLVFVEGRLQTRKWQDQSGQDRWTTEVVAVRVQGLDRPGAQEGGWQGQRQGQPQQRPQQGPPQQGPQQGPPDHDEDPGPAFPSEASDMDKVPF
jgi:single-strand DNA-binding protein